MPEKKDRQTIGNVDISDETFIKDNIEGWQNILCFWITKAEQEGKYSSKGIETP